MIYTPPMMRRYRTLKSLGERVEVDQRKRHERPFFLTFNRPNFELTVPASLSAQVTMTNSGEGPLEITKLSAERTDEMLVTLQIEDGTTQRALMNNAIHIDTIFGTGAQPYILPEALYIHEKSSLIFRGQDLSGSDNVVSAKLDAAQYTQVIYDPKMTEIVKRFRSKEKMSMPFWYTFDQGPVTLGAGLSTLAPIEISGEGHFLLTQISGVQTGSYAFDLINSNDGSSIFDAPEGTNYRNANSLIVGSGNFPYRFDQGILYEAGSKLIVDLLDTSGAENTIHLTLGGIWLTEYMWM